MKKLLLVCAVATSFWANAQWKKLDNSPMYTSSLATMGNTVFVGMAGSGVYVTTDGGTTFTQKNNGLNAGAGVDVRHLGAIGNVIYAGTSNEGLYKSTDMGETWIMDTVGLNYWAFGPQDHNTMAVIDDKIFVTKNQYGLYYKTNNDTKWTQTAFPVGTDQRATCIIKVGAELYLSSIFSGVYKSTDGGINWAQTTMTNFPKGSFGYEQLNDIRYFNGKMFGGGYRGLFVSPDKAESWTQINQFKDSVIERMFVYENKLFFSTDKGGVYQTTDGTTFTNISAGLSGRKIAAYTVIGKDLYATQGKDGVYKMSNIFTWTGIAAQATTSKTLSVYPNPANNFTQIKAEPNSSVELYTITGILVQKTTTDNNGQATFELNNTPKGIYLVKNSTTQGEIRRLIVQ